MPINTLAALLHGFGSGISAAFELPGRLALSWAGASGMLAGGVWVALLVWLQRTSSSVTLLITTVFFIVFGALGFIHGGVLGYLARRRDRSRWFVARSLLWAAFLGAPMLALLWEFAVWISMTQVALRLGRPGMLIGLAFSWLALAVVCSIAVVQGVIALKRAYATWPESRIGTLLVAITFAFLLLNFLSEPPVVWGSNLRVTGVGALLLAAGVTVWIASPVIVLSLQLLHRKLFARSRVLGVRLW